MIDAQSNNGMMDFPVPRLAQYLFADGACWVSVDRDTTLRGMRADVRESGGLCLRPSLTAIGPAAYGHRLPPRQDFPGLVGCVLRCRCLRRRGADGTCGHGNRRHPVDPLRAEAAADRSGVA